MPTAQPTPQRPSSASKRSGWQQPLTSSSAHSNIAAQYAATTVDPDMAHSLLRLQSLIESANSDLHSAQDERRAIRESWQARSRAAQAFRESTNRDIENDLIATLADITNPAVEDTMERGIRLDRSLLQPSDAPPTGTTLESRDKLLTGVKSAVVSGAAPTLVEAADDKAPHLPTRAGPLDFFEPVPPMVVDANRAAASRASKQHPGSSGGLPSLSFVAAKVMSLLGDGRTTAEVALAKAERASAMINTRLLNALAATNAAGNPGDVLEEMELQHVARDLLGYIKQLLGQLHQCDVQIRDLHHSVVARDDTIAAVQAKADLARESAVAAALERDAVKRELWTMKAAAKLRVVLNRRLKRQCETAEKELAKTKQELQRANALAGGGGGIAVTGGAQGASSDVMGTSFATRSSIHHPLSSLPERTIVHVAVDDYCRLHEQGAASIDAALCVFRACVHESLIETCGHVASAEALASAKNVSSLGSGSLGDMVSASDAYSLSLQCYLGLNSITEPMKGVVLECGDGGLVGAGDGAYYMIGFNDPVIATRFAINLTNVLHCAAWPAQFATRHHATLPNVTTSDCLVVDMSAEEFKESRHVAALVSHHLTHVMPSAAVASAAALGNVMAFGEGARVKAAVGMTSARTKTEIANHTPLNVDGCTDVARRASSVAESTCPLPPTVMRPSQRASDDQRSGLVPTQVAYPGNDVLCRGLRARIGIHSGPVALESVHVSGAWADRMRLRTVVPIRSSNSKTKYKATQTAAVDDAASSERVEVVVAHGDTPMKAAMLCRQARGGEILVSESVMGKVKTWLKTTALAFHRPIAAAEALGTTPQSRRLGLRTDLSRAGLFQADEVIHQVLPGALARRAEYFSVREAKAINDAALAALLSGSAASFNPNWWIRFNDAPPIGTVSDSATLAATTTNSLAAGLGTFDGTMATAAGTTTNAALLMSTRWLMAGGNAVAPFASSMRLGVTVSDTFAALKAEVAASKAMIEMATAAARKKAKRCQDAERVAEQREQTQLVLHDVPPSLLFAGVLTTQRILSAGALKLSLVNVNVGAPHGGAAVTPMQFAHIAETAAVRSFASLPHTEWATFDAEYTTTCRPILATSASTGLSHALAEEDEPQSPGGSTPSVGQLEASTLNMSSSATTQAAAGAKPTFAVFAVAWIAQRDYVALLQRWASTTTIAVEAMDESALGSPIHGADSAAASPSSSPASSPPRKMPNPPGSTAVSTAAPRQTRARHASFVSGTAQPPSLPQRRATSARGLDAGHSDTRRRSSTLSTLRTVTAAVSQSMTNARRSLAAKEQHELAVLDRAHGMPTTFLPRLVARFVVSLRHSFPPTASLVQTTPSAVTPLSSFSLATWNAYMNNVMAECALRRAQHHHAEDRETVVEELAAWVEHSRADLEDLTAAYTLSKEDLRQAKVPVIPSPQGDGCLLPDSPVVLLRMLEDRVAKIAQHLAASRTEVAALLRGSAAHTDMMRPAGGALLSPMLAPSRSSASAASSFSAPQIPTTSGNSAGADFGSDALLVVDGNDFSADADNAVAGDRFRFVGRGVVRHRGLRLAVDFRWIATNSTDLPLSKMARYGDKGGIDVVAAAASTTASAVDREAAAAALTGSPSLELSTMDDVVMERMKSAARSLLLARRRLDAALRELPPLRELLVPVRATAVGVRLPLRNEDSPSHDKSSSQTSGSSPRSGGTSAARGVALVGELVPLHVIAAGPTAAPEWVPVNVWAEQAQYASSSSDEYYGAVCRLIARLVMGLEVLHRLGMRHGAIEWSSIMVRSLPSIHTPEPQSPSNAATDLLRTANSAKIRWCGAPSEFVRPSRVAFEAPEVLLCVERSTLTSSSGCVSSLEATDSATALSDWWSLGVVAYSLCTPSSKGLPFQPTPARALTSLSEVAMLDAVRRGSRHSSMRARMTVTLMPDDDLRAPSHLRGSIPPPHYVEAVLGMLMYDPRRRLDPSSLISALRGNPAVKAGVVMS